MWKNKRERMRQWATSKENPCQRKRAVPTTYFAIEALMILCTIDALEKRDEGIIGIPGVLMHADMVCTIHMKMEGRLTESMDKLDPKI